ncbi:hypothetical protein D9M69_476740 [compost metagenome]
MTTSGGAVAGQKSLACTLQPGAGNHSWQIALLAKRFQLVEQFDSAFRLAVHLGDTSTYAHGADQYLGKGTFLDQRHEDVQQLTTRREGPHQIVGFGQQCGDRCVGGAEALARRLPTFQGPLQVNDRATHLALQQVAKRHKGVGVNDGSEATYLLQRCLGGDGQPPCLRQAIIQKQQIGLTVA